MMTAQIHRLLSPRGSLFILLVFCAGAQLCLAQTTFERTYGGYAGHSAQQTLDGGYIMCGSITATGGHSDIYLVKTNSYGDTLWTRTYGGPGNDFGNSVQRTSEGGYIIGGLLSFDPGDGTGRVYLVKVDARGDTLWTSRFGGSSNDPSIQQTFDGGYIVAYYGAHIQAAVSAARLVKTNSIGKVLWEKSYGIPPGAIWESYTHAYSVQRTSEGGYIVAGGDWRKGAFLLKTDAMGDTLWTKTYGSSHDEARSVQQTVDNGYIVTGNTNSSALNGGGIFLLRANAQGDSLWARACGSPDARGYSVRQTSDGGYVVAGSTRQISPYNNEGDLFLLRTNSFGDTLWMRTFGGRSSDAGYSVEQTSDGGYVVAGTTCSFSPDSSSRMYLIKTDADGRVSPPGSIDSLFSRRVDLSTGSYPWSTTAEDFDGDSKVDVAAAVYDENVVGLFRNVGSAGTLSAGSFASRVTFPTGAGPTGIASGDFDSDGKVDLAISSAASGTVSILKNTSIPGTIQFATSMDIPVGKDPKGLAVWDLDEDGKKDIVVPNEGDSSVSILCNASSIDSISFSAMPAIRVGPAPLKAMIADLDRDDRADIAVVNNGSSSISLLRNMSTVGTISFDSPLHFGTGSAPGRMAIADIDGDEAPDLIVDNINDGALSLYQNISTPGWFSFGSPREVPAGRKPWCVGTADFNGDDKTDIAVTNYQDSTVTIFVNKTWKDPYSFRVDLQNAGTLRTGMNPLHVGVNDLDGDGNPDLVVACRVSNTLSLFRNLSDAAALPAAPALLSPGNGARDQPTSVRLKWSRPRWVASYHLQVATDSLFVDALLDDSTLTEPTRLLSSLGKGQEYFWRVSARNGLGASPFSQTNAFSTLLTAIDETDDIPREFALNQNYPNPFNPRTEVRSQMSEARHVKLAVYDLLGREVAVLVNERRAAGRYQDTFDASGLASGIYICRMTAGAFAASLKMLLVK